MGVLFSIVPMIRGICVLYGRLHCNLPTHYLWILSVCLFSHNEQAHHKIRGLGTWALVVYFSWCVAERPPSLMSTVLLWTRLNHSLFEFIANLFYLVISLELT